jgi:penicillin-binding protein 1A
MGLTPELVTGVWVGAEDRAVRFKTMKWGQGARMALPIFGYFMQSLYSDKSIGLSTADFKEPAGYDPNEFDCENTEDSTNSSSFGI